MYMILYLQGKNNIVKHGIACVTNLKSSQMIRGLFNDSTEDIIVECKFNDKFQKWEPLQKVNDSMSRSMIFNRLLRSYVYFSFYAFFDALDDLRKSS